MRDIPLAELQNPVKARLGGFLGAALCALWLVAPGAAAPDIAVFPESPRVGEAMFVTLRPERALLRAACSWAGRSYEFLPTGEAFEVVLPISLKTRPGAGRATVYWKYADGAMGRLTLPVQVRSRRFEIQRLRLSRAQEQKYSAPETKRERELIGTALDRVEPERYWRERFLMPVEGRVSTGFGLQRYINGRLVYRHRGIDIAAPAGTPVRAAADGVVSLADDSFLLHGKTIVIDHGHGISTLYLHLSELAVAAGERVSQGQIIATVGATGVATGPHLHFAVYAFHEAVDPLFWINLEPPGQP